MTASIKLGKNEMKLWCNPLLNIPNKHTSAKRASAIESIMLYLISLFFTYFQIVYSQTACQFFSSTGNNYTAWSESHIATWCKDHDPSSTSQCASESAPLDEPEYH